MAKYVSIKQQNGPTIKKVVCEVCGAKYDRMTTANACEAGHFLNLEKPKKGGGTNGKEKRSDGAGGGR